MKSSGFNLQHENLHVFGQLNICMNSDLCDVMKGSCSINSTTIGLIWNFGLWLMCGIGTQIIQMLLHIKTSLLYQSLQECLCPITIGTEFDVCIYSDYKMSGDLTAKLGRPDTNA